MHFVTGGAFNGKSNWVRNFYHLEGTTYLWISAYSQPSIPEDVVEWPEETTIVLEGIEQWLKLWVDQYEMREIRCKWQQLLQKWLETEQQSQQRLILIGTDLSKGIVPMSAKERKWRDVTGWAFQDTASMAESADLVWYGINKRLK